MRVEKVFSVDIGITDQLEQTQLHFQPLPFEKLLSSVWAGAGLPMEEQVLGSRYVRVQRRVPVPVRTMVGRDIRGIAVDSNDRNLFHWRMDRVIVGIVAPNGR